MAVKSLGIWMPKAGVKIVWISGGPLQPCLDFYRPLRPHTMRQIVAPEWRREQMRMHHDYGYRSRMEELKLGRT